ncbi:MAG TPA: hypothetical protein PLO23_01190 [Alphaproteobacteria bacterium]|nr:hypothetical protein [Alphaproteobacteria bacterium]
MKTRSFVKFAAFGALALGVAFGASPAKAQVDFEPGVPEVININAAVDNTITATVTEPDFGDLGVVASQTPGGQAILELTTAGALVTGAAIDGDSRILSGGGQVAGSVAIGVGGAFPTTPVYTTYSAPVDLTCGACAAPNADLLIFEVTDDLAGGGGCTGGLTAGVLDTVTPANTATGCETTAGDGSLPINIGVTIATEDGNAVRPIYNTGTYVGSVSLLLEY